MYLSQYNLCQRYLCREDRIFASVPQRIKFYQHRPLHTPLPAPLTHSITHRDATIAFLASVKAFVRRSDHIRHRWCSSKRPIASPVLDMKHPTTHHKKTRMYDRRGRGRYSNNRRSYRTLERVALPLSISSSWLVWVRNLTVLGIPKRIYFQNAFFLATRDPSWMWDAHLREEQEKSAKRKESNAKYYQKKPHYQKKNKK